ncbi:MAG TPA: NAD(P)H-dependent glycerol-3-phosphate dehydrogenase [Kofleriaceae bacterium]|jgi:glycerol-3-phosphate dehydrogenase (NAD(P)+)|nr:NAD(P)H-dependent glycerol-3-phosphate dehydrogenase [Kofleriaceae bacterium]
MSSEDIAVIGAGSYGTCLAVLFGNAGHRVSLYCRGAQAAHAIDAARENTAYLPGHRLPDSVQVTSDLAAAVRAKRFVVGVVPSHGTRAVLGQAAQAMDPDAIVINASKGLEDGTLQSIDAVYRDVLPARIAARATYLSGPTFASELAAGMPAAIVLAGHDPETRAAAQQALSHLHFRIYTTDDVLGVLIGGALKNVIAIGAGISDGLGYGSNSRIALITRGLAEITRMGVALGAHAQTFAGLSGMGDLVLTCSGDASRNRRVGLALGRGKSMTEILGETTQVAEGVKTAKVAKELAAKIGVEAPITDAMYAIMHAGVPVREAIHALLTRPFRSERD